MLTVGHDHVRGGFARTTGGMVTWMVNQFGSPEPQWVSERVTVIGDAAHGLSPHISAGGTLGIEDVRVLARLLKREAHVKDALKKYEANRIPHYRKVHDLADAVEATPDAKGYAHGQARFAHWMLNEGAVESLL